MKTSLVDSKSTWNIFTPPRFWKKKTWTLVRFRLINRKRQGGVWSPPVKKYLITVFVYKENNLLFKFLDTYVIVFLGRRQTKFARVQKLITHMHDRGQFLPSAHSFSRIFLTLDLKRRTSVTIHISKKLLYTFSRSNRNQTTDCLPSSIELYWIPHWTMLWLSYNIFPSFNYGELIRCFSGAPNKYNYRDRLCVLYD